MQPSWLRHRLGIIWREHADKGNRAGGKMRGIFRLTVLVGAGAAMLGIAAPHHAFAAASRAAQPNSTASDQFADAFFAIASHGDLLDIPFIEQTLQTRFQSRLAIEGGGIPNPKRTIYETGAILGTAISVELDVNADTEQQAKRQFIGIMRFNYVTSIGLSKTQIDQRFVGYTIHPTFVPMENGFTVTLNGKSGSKIAAFYSVRNFDDHVSDFVISQRP